jgi:hypothetical protein
MQTLPASPTVSDSTPIPNGHKPGNGNGENTRGLGIWGYRISSLSIMSIFLYLFLGMIEDMRSAQQAAATALLENNTKLQKHLETTAQEAKRAHDMADARAKNADGAMQELLTTQRKLLIEAKKANAAREGVDGRQP